MSMMKKTALPLMLLCLLCAGCATTGGRHRGADCDRGTPRRPRWQRRSKRRRPPRTISSKQEEGEVALPVAESEQPTQPTEEVIVKATRHQVIHDLVAEGSDTAARRRAPVLLHRERARTRAPRPPGGLRPVE
jgi:hypothetical protein